MSEPLHGTFAKSGFLDGKFVSITGYSKNTNGLENIEYSGDGAVGVCMKSYWKKYLKKERPKKTRWAG